MRFPPAVLSAGSAVLLSVACLGSPSPPPSAAPAGPPPTLLPPPAALSSPPPEVAVSPGPLFVTPVAATPNPAAIAPSAPGSTEPGEEHDEPGDTPARRAKVANTEGQGANMRTEPAAGATLVRTVREGTELDLIGADVEAGGRRWRNVRNPADGATGWIVADLLAEIADEPPAAGQPPGGGSARPAASPAPSEGGSASGGPGVGSAPGGPSAGPSPAASGRAASGAAPSATGPRIDEADRAYLSAIKPHLETLDAAISSANSQVSAAETRPAALDDPAWRESTEALAQRFAGAGGGLRTARAGPNTGDVREPATRAADRADEVARILSTAVANRDARAVGSVRLALVRLLSEVANMNRAILQPQARSPIPVYRPELRA